MPYIVHAPSSWSVYVIDGSFFLLWHGLHRRSPRIRNLLIVLVLVIECWEAAEMRCQSQFRAHFATKVGLDACGLCRQDAFWLLTVDLHLCFLMPFGHLTLSPFVFECFGGKPDGKVTLGLRTFCGNLPWREPLKKGIVHYALSAVCWLVTCSKW